jgi:tetratricopeptide (TPR) repeat protein
MNAYPRWLPLLLVLAATGAARARAAEPVEAFLEALRGRKYYDEALDYLDQVEAVATLDAPLRERLPYERAVTMLSSAADAADPKIRQSRLDRAAELFETFYTGQPEHPLAGSARNQRASVLIERGRAALLTAEPASQEAAALSARGFFEQARDQFASAEKDLDAQLKKMPKLIAPDDRPLQAQKRQLSADLAQARLYRAGIDYELSKTHPPSGDKSKSCLTAAAASYAALYEAYRTRYVGLLARLWEGRCYQELGKHNQALGCFRELMDLPDSAETRSIRAKSTRHALECWTSDPVKNYQAAIERGERFEKESGSNATDPDSLAIRYLTAVAYRDQSQSLPDRDPNRKKLAGVARQVVGPVAEHPGEFQRPAKMLLVALSGTKNAKEPDAPPATFAEALEQARAALGRMQSAQGEISALGNADPAKLEALQKQKSDSADRAIDQLRLAISLRKGDTPLEELNAARYYLCFLSWDLGRYYDAAVLGEFLAQRFPDTLPGRQGARIALAAYVRLYTESKSEDRAFELANIQRIAELTFQRWPDQEEAEEAALTMVNFAAASQQIEKAAEYLDKISADSPRRAAAELRAGQALWSAYLRALRLPDEDRPPREKLDALKTQAQDILTRGIGRLDKAGAVDANLASAAFSLAQIALDTGQTNKAIELLEHPTYGAVTLVKANHPAVSREGFATETYKTALRAYIAAEPQQIKSAEQAMDALEKLVQGSGDAQASANLTAIYISLGRQLQDELQELRKSGKTKQLDAVSKAFEVFLERVIKRDTTGNYASLNWVGETYYSLGAGFDEGGTLVSPRAAAYFQKATTAYERMLALAEKDPKYTEQPDALLGIRLRLADCYRRGGDFDKAIKSVSDVLKEKSMLLAAQVQAAETYQSQGAVDPKAYALSIMGGMPARDGTNLIWGWAKISKMTMSNPKFAETFHQARLNIAEARYRYALAQKDKDRRTKILEAAVQDLWSTYKLRPDLGGPETTARYDRVLKTIQKALGQPDDGLAEFQKRDAANSGAAAK